MGRFVRGLGVTGPVELAIRTSSGHINVSAGRSGSVEIRGTISRRRDGAEEAEIRTRVDFLVSHPPIEQNGNIVKIGYATGEGRERDVSINYDVVVPRPTRLNAGTGSGSITVEGIAGPVEASAGSGAITAIDIGGDVRAGAGAGEIEVRRVKGSARLSTGSGPIHAADVERNFHAASASGAIEALRLGGREVEARTNSGIIDLRACSGSVRAVAVSGCIRIEGKDIHGALRVETVSGNIAVRLPASAMPEISARSVYGAIRTNRSVTVRAISKRGAPKARNDHRGMQLALETVSGNIQID